MRCLVSIIHVRNMTPSQMNLPQATDSHLENAQSIIYYVSKNDVISVSAPSSDYLRP